MKQFSIPLGCALSVFGVGTVWAEDPAAPAGDPISWSGPFVGLTLGWSDGSSNIVLPLSPPGFSQPDLSGASLGVELGYRRQFETGAVLGFAVAYDMFAGGRDRDALFGVVGAVYDLEATDQVSAQVQLGYAWNRTLVFAQGGMARLGVEGCGLVPALSSACVAGTDFAGDLSGWTAGVGMAYTLSDGWALSAELSHADFGTTRFSTPGVVGQITDVEATRTFVEIGVQRRF